MAVWTGTTLIARWRSLTGRGSTNDISDVDVLAAINRYYQEHFPLEIDLHEIEADYTAEAVVSDDGEFDLAFTTLDLNQPITVNGMYQLVFHHDPQRFFTKYPENRDEDYITPPTLAIGVSSAAAVLNAAFKFKMANWTYPKATAETALSGSTVPQNTYGAWLLAIDVDGAITVTAAADNATGYATAALAVNGIVLPGSTYAAMGFVTAINTAAGGFIPGTTLLSAATVTDTYTDGNPQLRNIPSDACIANGKLYIRPKPMDTYLIRAAASLTAPSALEAATSPPDESWGVAISTGSAIKWLAEVGDTSRAAELIGDANVIGTHNYNIKMLNRKRIFQDSERETYRSF